MMLALTIAGMLAGVWSIMLHRLRLVQPDPARVDFGTPISDAFLNVLAWACLVSIVLLSVQRLGILPALVILPVAFGLFRLAAAQGWITPRQTRLANPLALTTPVFVLILLQQIAEAIPVVDLTSMFLGLPSRAPVSP